MILWLDLETGGLCNDRLGSKLGCQFHPILQIACTLTSNNLEEVFSFNQHIKNNIELSQEIVELLPDSVITGAKNSKLSLDQAESILVDMLRGIKDTIYLAGNSIWFDRMFIEFQMPRIAKLLHYRMIDVSTIKVIHTQVLGGEDFRKKRKHDAMSDITETIEEYGKYLNLYFNHK